MATQFKAKAPVFSLAQTLAIFNMADLIERSLKAQNIEVPLRIHGDGDFWSIPYAAAWCVVASRRPRQVFYCYTKSIREIIAVHELGLIPPNFRVTASMGGRYDELALSRPDVFPRRAWVVFSEADAEARGLHIDHDDSTPQSTWTGDFGLLLHGTQPKGSPAAKAHAALRKQGIHGYGRKAGTKRPKLLTLAQCQAQNILYISPGNSKVAGAVLFSLPAGHTCPGASLCLSKADRETGRITDGPCTQFRCFAASGEAKNPSARATVWHNLDLLTLAAKAEA